MQSNICLLSIKNEIAYVGRLFWYDDATEGLDTCTCKSINSKHIENVSNKHLETNERTFVNARGTVEMQDPFLLRLI